jgi:hypothetical protein
MRFEDFPGKTVLHCHNLVHEDRGMMMAIKILGGPAPLSRCDPKKPPGPILVGGKAPDWWRPIGRCQTPMEASTAYPISKANAAC